MRLSKQFNRQKKFSLLSPMLISMMMLTMLCAASAFAQETPKYEFGAHFSVIRLSDLDSTDVGVGGRFGFNVNDRLGLEAEITSFPQFEGRLFRGGRKVQGLFGAKYGVRSDKFGVFAKLRPGFMRFSTNEVGSCQPGPVCPAIIVLQEQTNFALDLGGVVEFYPSRHFVTRIDLGDTIVRFGENSYPEGRPYTGHNLQISVGFGVRF